jgi:biotin carboxylase
MSDVEPITLLCLASYEKGFDFLREAKAQGCRVYLVTTTKLQEVEWPREAIDEIFYVPDMYNRQDIIYAISYLARSHRIDRIVPLDDFDVEIAAALREHMRVPGMGDTTARFFRDKLAMRVRAQDDNFLVPPFTPVLNYDKLRLYMEHVPAPWVLKPRSEASAVGIKKVHNSEELWRALDVLGDRQSYYVLEKYIPGEVFHVDAILNDRQMVFAEVHQYARPPLDVVEGGGIFASRTVPRGSSDHVRLVELCDKLIHALGLVRGITHTEFIKHEADGEFYFLETAARVGGANIAEMVEGASGINLWREWAKVEIAAAQRIPYTLPPIKEEYAGVIVSLARQEWPDHSVFSDPEVSFRLHKKNHVGIIVHSPDVERVAELQDQYMRLIQEQFHASMPAPDKPTS